MQNVENAFESKETNNTINSANMSKTPLSSSLFLFLLFSPVIRKKQEPKPPSCLCSLSSRLGIRIAYFY